MKDVNLIQYSVADTGGIVAGIFAAGDEYKFKTVSICGDKSPMTEIVKTLSKSIGREIKYNCVTAEQFASFGFPGAEDLAAMFLFYTDYGFDRDLVLSKKLYPAIKSFKDWTLENKDKFAAK
jgi:1-aminocyclopropane-1-carboxylate deaminase/D-cysteine desulfhydrase-like pyridoxal-dependent ACC family enzyme